MTKLSTIPEGFTVIAPQLSNPGARPGFIEQRQAMAAGERPLDWSAGEWMAYATLLTEGHHIRLTGQDVQRGTFTHRHAAWRDVKTGELYVPFNHIQETQARMRIHNSSLSEFGCMGFEYGYSLDYPDALVIWEAQFGDFANGAQVMIDQFIAAAETKWRRQSGLTLLLPHGYEGQGPEHSSARLERFLQLCAEDNLQVCYPTTPAQMFHLLRRQIHREVRKPLVVMTPKSLLRNPAATSPLDDLAKGRFYRLMRETEQLDPKKVSRLLLCTGKVYYDLVAERAKRDDKSVAVVRVEQLYPLAESELVEVFKSYPQLKEIFWVQEEPKNMGAWSFMFPHLQQMVSQIHKTLTVGYIGRMEAASPAAGFLKAHELEQKLIVDQALSRE
jgi:2-oxoglutarate dehydrogenase E1 component